MSTKTPDEIVSSASYIVFKSGSLIVAQPSRRSGLKKISGTNSNTVMQSVIDAMHSGGGGTIVTKEVIVPDGLTHYADALVIENYKGTGREFRVLADGYLYKLGLQPYIIDRPSIPQWESVIGQGGAQLVDGYLCKRQRYDNVVTSETYFAGSIGYGTYEFKGKASGMESTRDMYLGFAEQFPSQYRDSIFLYWVGSSSVWRFYTYRAGVASGLAVEDVDFTVEHLFKIEYSASLARLSVDGVVKVTITTNIPDPPLIVFMETRPTSSGTNHLILWAKDWVKIA